MGASTAPRIPSFDELYQAIEALPPGLTGEILEPGVIRTMGRPGGAHRYSAWGIRRSLGDDDAGEKGSGWWFEQEAEVRFPKSRLAVPDLAAWRLSEGDPIPPSFVYGNPIARSPDWCCELLSPSTETVDREVKVPLYAQSGVEWIWLVDPLARRIEVLRTDHQHGTAALADIFEGVARRAVPPFLSVVDTARWWLPPAAG